jgi:hypothetical protein
MGIDLFGRYGYRSVPASRKIRFGTLEVPDFPKLYNQGTSDCLYEHSDLSTEPPTSHLQEGTGGERKTWRLETAKGGEWVWRLEIVECGLRLRRLGNGCGDWRL